MSFYTTSRFKSKLYWVDKAGAMSRTDINPSRNDKEKTSKRLMEDEIFP